VPFEYQPYRSDLTGTIADLMTRGDRARAEALRAGGAAQARAAEVSGRNAQELAGTIGNIAQGVGHQVTQYYEDKPRMEMQQLQLDAAKRDAHEEAALRAIFAKPEPPKPEEIYQAVGPKKGAEILKGFAALRQENQKSYTSTQQLVGSITGGILALPEGLRAEAYTHARENLVSRGLVDPAQVPEQYDPAFLQSAHVAAMTPDKQEDALNPRPVAVGSGGLANPRTGEMVVQPAAKAAPVEKPPAVGSFEDYVVRKYGQNPTPEQITEGRKTYQQADDRPIQPRITVNTPGAPGTALDPDGLEYAATQYRVTGAMPSLGNGNGQIKAAIINAAAKQTKALSQSPAVAIQKQAARKADGAALTAMTKASAAAESFETKAIAQADIVRGLSNKVSRTQFPIINGALLAGQRDIAGDANTQLLFNALTTFTSEYAKIVEGSTGSAAGSSDAARRAAASLISASLNKGTLAQTLDLMQKEMRLTVQGYGATIDHITGRMGGVPAQPGIEDTKVPVPAPAAPGGMPSYADYLKTKGKG
jgi:hypothetical protein